MKKIQIRPLKGIYRLIEKNKQKRKSTKKNWMNADKYKQQFEETLLLITK